MRASSLIGVAVFCLLALNGPAHQVNAHGESATVRIVAVDPFGHDIGDVVIDSFKDESQGRQLASRFHENSAVKIPYGVYRLRAHECGTWTSEKRVFVFKPEVWVMLGLEFGEEGAAGPSPRWVETGTIKNIDLGEQPIYVKLLGIYLDYVVEDRVDILKQSGSFTLAGQNAPGRYLLLTVGRTRVLDIRQIEIPAKAPIEIDLSSDVGPKSSKPF